MTAFARQETQTEAANFFWEIRSVNHRYLEVSVRIPEQLRQLENPIRELCKKHLKRGKIECTLRYQLNDINNPDITINESLVQALSSANISIQSLHSNAQAMSVSEILQWPGVLQGTNTDFKSMHSDCTNLFKAALDELIELRQREGEALKVFIQQRLDSVSKEVTTMAGFIPDMLDAQQEKLRTRVQDALEGKLDNDRLEQELVHLAQKADVDEELDRLTVHVAEVSRTLNQGGAVGRRLDFLMQELNREANTLGSKSIHAQSTQAAVELKVVIEQMREQIQNIE